MFRAIVLGAVVACNFHPGAVPFDEAGVPGEAGAPHDAKLADAHGDARMLDAKPDAPMPSLCNMVMCMAAHGMCAGDECVINVADGTPPSACPTGMKCHYNCNSGTACKTTIDCSTAAACTIDCQVQNACDGSMVDCSGGGCTVYCRDTSTCTNMTFACGTETCDLECCPATSCGQNIVFTGPHVENSPGTCPAIANLDGD